MKKLSYWIAPCLCVSLYFADFAQVARAEGVDDSPADAEARPGGGGGAPHAAPAPHVSAPPARPAAPAAPRQGTVPQMTRPAPRNMSPRQAPSPEANQARQVAQQQQAVREHAAQQEAAQRGQAARVEAAKERANDNAERAQNGTVNRNVAAERAREAAQTQEAATQREERNRAAVAADQNRAEQAQERAREAQGNRQNEAAQNQERAREAMTGRREEAQNRAAENQDRVKEAQDRARETQANRQNEAAQNLNRQREELQNRAAENRERMQDAQERLRNNVAGNQERLREAQDRAREAQANLRERVSDSVEQRRAAYQNARQLAAQAQRPFLERPGTAFSPQFNDTARAAAWQNRWANWGVANRIADINDARAAQAQRIALATNYQRAVNWSYQPSYWGSRPWWNANANHNWYTGSWNYGWNRSWYGRQYWYAPGAWPGYVVRDNGIGNGIAWGLAGWGLGSLIYDSGYEVYGNPYATAPYVYGDTTIDYREPFTTIAANYPTGDEARSKTSSEKSSEALERSRQAFRDGDYMTALKANDEAISYEPGDSSLHEYRALILFSLNRYGDTAGVLNSILASGPGWDYNTMIGFYPDPKVYDGQLAKLEDYSRNKPDAADAHFVLGYHYMVAGNLDGAGHEFDQVVQLQPRDTIAKQLRDLVHSSVKDPDASAPSQPVEGTDRPANREVIEQDQLVGNWTTDRGNAGTVTLNLQDNGQFRWKFDHSGSKANSDSELKGTYNIDDRGLLVLKSDSSQMVGEISMPQNNQLVFVLAGGPEGDPGLKFNRE